MASASAAADVGADARSVKVENPLVDFEYGYPASAAAIPALRAILEKDIVRQKAQVMADARSDQLEAKKASFPFHAHSLSYDWKVVTDLPRWLSLSTLVATYTGGAHPNYVFDTLLWDKTAHVRRDPLDLFVSKAALSHAIRKDFCVALDKERAKKRGEPKKAGSTDEFDACIDPAAETVILGSRGRTGFDRVGILVPPYEAGPYAEGDYEVTLPVTPAVIAAVKPQYRAAFSAP